MDLRTISLISKYLNQDDFKLFGNIIDFNNSATFMPDSETAYNIRIIEIEQSELVMDVLCSHFQSQIIMIPLEHVKYFLPVGPEIDQMRTRPFPGTNEIKVFYSEGMQGFILKKGVWFAKPIVTKSSQWIEISKSFEYEKRNYANILKVNFKCNCCVI